MIIWHYIARCSIKWLVYVVYVGGLRQLQKLFTSVAFTCLGQPIPTEGEPVDRWDGLGMLIGFSRTSRTSQQITIH
jgi:hypothetical protein